MNLWIMKEISNLDYKINVDLSNFYGGMHVEFLN